MNNILKAESILGGPSRSLVDVTNSPLSDEEMSEIMNRCYDDNKSTEISISPGQLWRHFKGAIYEIVDLATHTETGEVMVVYKRTTCDDGVNNTTNNIWVRPLEMFTSKVDREKYPDVEQEYRFEFISLNQ